MATVQLQKLTKTYPERKGPGVRVVHDIDLEIRDGEFMVLVGPSGCGKSTTLRMIAGLEEITSGSVSIDGRVVNDILPKDRDIAMVFQNYALYPHMTVYDNMAFGLKLRRLPRTEIDRRVREAAAMLGLDDYLPRKPKALSGGQRQRVAVGRAIVRKPKVFLFDEPLSNLDAKMRVAMRTEISKLHAQLGATMIYVTHDQVEAMTMGDRICVMHEGRIMQVDEPLTLYRQPDHAYVASFIGSPPMNLIRGYLTDLQSSPRFVESMESPASPESGPALSVPLRNVPADWLQRNGRPRTQLGIRPEDIHAEPKPGTIAFSGRIELCEPMGGETHIHFRTASHAIVARMDSAHLLEPMANCTLYLDLSKVHLFESDTGAVIRPTTPPLDHHHHD